MTKPEDRAFPTQGIETDHTTDTYGNVYDRAYSYDEHSGLTKLEYIATHAMQGMLANDRTSAGDIERIATLAYSAARSLIQKLNGK